MNPQGNAVTPGSALTASGGGRLLLVDSDEAVREALGDAFRFQGFEVEAVADADSARRSCRARSFDCALVDVCPDGATGWETLKSLAGVGSLPVAVMSVGSGLLRRARTFGVEQVWEKPLAVEEVSAWIRDRVAAARRS